VQYDFEESATISSCEVYWFDEEPRDGGVRVPQFWKLFYKGERDWKPVLTSGGFSVAKDRFNRVTFTPVKTKSIRIIATLQPQFSAGILEWKVK
jgi:hypothetical protein